MALRRPLCAFLVGLAVMFATVATAQGTEALAGDPELGKTVYQKIGYCVSCQGSAGDGLAGRNPMTRASAADLLKSALDAEGLSLIIRCGLLGTQMPFHEAAAYRDDRCHGMVMADFEPGKAPVRGKTFRDKDLAHLVAYLQRHMIGFGKEANAECADYYGPSSDKACAYLRTE